MSVFKKYISQNEGNIGAQNEVSATPHAEDHAAATRSSAYTSPAADTTPRAAQPQQQARPSNTSQIAAGSGRNMLSSDVEIKGRVKFSNDLVVDGKIEGEIDSDGSLTVGENARVRAEIRTRSVVIYGKVHGNITVTDRVEIKANAELIGDIKASTLSIEAGAIFVGKSTVGAASVTDLEPLKEAAKKENAPTASADQAKKSPVTA